MTRKSSSHLRHITLPGQNRTEGIELNSPNKAPIDLFGPRSIFSPVEDFSPSFMSDMFGPGKLRPIPGMNDDNAEQNPTPPEITERVIFDPADDRQPVFNTTSSPWRCVCRLQTNMTNGSRAFGTGWFAAPNIIVTAAHCIYDVSGVEPAEVIVTPGLSPNSQPYGSETSYNVRVPDEWVDNKNDSYDYGIIILPTKNMGNMTGWFGFAVAKDAHLDNLPIISAGYPTDYGSQTQVWCLGKINKHSRDFIHHNVDTETGQSGGPIFHEHQSNYRTVIGIHTGSGGFDEPNVGVRITPTIFKDISKAIKQNA